MIPSQNNEEVVLAAQSNPHATLICDCCNKHFWNQIVDVGFYRRDGILKIKVRDVTYIACSGECARILFNIHHQYALQEMGKK